MNQTEFVAATAIILFVAFGLGWVTHWAVARFSRVTQADMGELDTLASQLHDAEEERDSALTLLEERERAMSSQMAQLEAELSAAMDGLREARRDAQDLRGQLERAGRARG